MEYAKVVWNVVDIKELRPGWSDEKCEEFLVDNEKQIREQMVEGGWWAIEELLAEEESERRSEQDTSLKRS